VPVTQVGQRNGDDQPSVDAVCILVVSADVADLCERSRASMVATSPTTWVLQYERL